MVAPILKTKLNIPAIRDETLERNHLLEQLDMLLEAGCKMCLVAAPAGFGKTTIVVQWLKRVLGWNIGWLALDREHNEPSRFLRYFITMIEARHPNALSDIRGAVDAGMMAGQDVISHLINWLAAAETNSLLILDDYHEISDQRVHDLISYFVEALPENTRLILTSRVDPPLPLSRMRVRRQLIELRAANLRFTMSETQGFLDNVMGLQVNPGIVAALEARTEGWAVGLQLAALSLSKIADNRERQQFITAFTGSHRHIVDYLVEEVLERQPDNVLDFLLKTSILDRFCPSLCDQVTKNKDSRTLLDYLDRANLFLIPLDNEKQWYRYHHLFADLLRSHLRQHYTDGINELHSYAAAWFEQQGLVYEAVHHALTGKDFDRAARLIMANAPNMMFRGEVAIIHEWLSALPDAVILAHPRLCLDRARLLLLQHQIHGVDELLDAAEQSIQAETNETQHMLMGSLTALRAYPAFERYQFESSIEYSKRALTYFPEDKNSERGACLLYLGHALHFGGWTRDAVPAFLDAITLLQKAQNTFSTMMSMGQLATIYELLGNLHQARAILDDAFEWAAIHKVQTLSPMAVPHARMANILREWNVLDEAEAHLRTALGLAKGGRPLVLMRIYALLARVLLARADWTGAEQAMQQARHIVSKWQTTIERSFVEYNHTLLLLRQGHLVRVEQWLQMENLKLPDVSQPLHNYTEQKLLLWARYLITTAREQADADNFVDALELLNRLYQIAVKAGRMGIGIEVRILQALAHGGLGHHTKMTSTLSEALRYAAPQGYMRIFLDEGQPLLDLLAQLPPEHPHADYIQQVLNEAQYRSSNAKPAAKGLYQTPDGLLLETLSERELQVLHLLAEGLSSNAVAEHLVIAIETARKHIKNIYSKLDVHNKVEAVRRAQELRLL